MCACVYVYVCTCMCVHVYVCACVYACIAWGGVLQVGAEVLCQGRVRGTGSLALYHYSAGLWRRRERTEQVSGVDHLLQWICFEP